MVVATCTAVTCMRSLRLDCCCLSACLCRCLLFLFFFFFSFFRTLLLSSSGQAVVTGVVPSPPRFLPSIFIAHRVQQSHCSSIFRREMLTLALALSASQFVHKKKSQRFYTSMQSAGLELTKLTYTRLEDNLIRHRGDIGRRLPVEQKCSLYQGSIDAMLQVVSLCAGTIKPVFEGD